MLSAWCKIQNESSLRTRDTTEISEEKASPVLYGSSACIINGAVQVQCNSKSPLHNINRYIPFRYMYGPHNRTHEYVHA